MKILIVEDDKNGTELLRVFFRVLARNGEQIEAVFAEDGDSARRLLAEERPDVVLTDNNFPQGNGLEMLQLARLANTPAIFMSALTTGDDALAEQARKMGAVAVLPKPFSLNRLSEAVTEAKKRML